MIGGVCVCLLAILPVITSLGTIVVPGDVYIEIIEGLYLDDSCTIVEPESSQNMQAVKWTLERLNDAQFMPGFKIGEYTY